MGQRNASLARWQDTLTHAVEQGVQQGVQRADPDLAEVVQLAQQVLVTERRPGGLLDPSKPSTFKVADLKKPLRAYLYVRRNPTVLYAAPIGILALAFLLGRASKTSAKEHA
jgi:hypothetical protein